MSYIYDIYLNFMEVPYDFYDWNRNDLLTHIKKAPIFKTNSESFKAVMKYNIKIKQNLIKYINNKTEVWNNNSKPINCALITDSNNIIALLFDNNGKSIKRSFLMIDEELEILDDLIDVEEIELEFEVLNSINYNFKTRKQTRNDEFVAKELKNINYDRLKYIYYDCFNKVETNKDAIIKKLKSIPKASKDYQNLYNILKLTSISKNKMI